MTNKIIDKKNKHKQVKKYLKELSDAGLIKYTENEDGEGLNIQLMNLPTLIQKTIINKDKEEEKND